MQTVRLRDKAKVIQLNIPAHKVDAVRYIQKTFFGNKTKGKYLKEVLGHSLCCLCDTGIPSVLLKYDLGGFKKIEYYCDSCISKVYERDEPEDKDELAAKYGCVAVNSEDMPRRDIFNKTTD
jgi:hypothetical protein